MELHEWIVATLVHRLRDWAMARRAGIVLASGYKVKIREDRGFMPDVQYFQRGPSRSRGSMPARRISRSR